MEAGEQAPSTASIPAKTQPISIKSQKVPLIFISEQKSWMESKELIQQSLIQNKHCVTNRNFIPIPPSRIQDHRSITQMSDVSNYEYHTFKLPEEKTLRVLLCSIPHIPSTDGDKQNLIDVEFEVISAVRLQEKIERTRIDMRLILG